MATKNEARDHWIIYRKHLSTNVTEKHVTGKIQFERENVNTMNIHPSTITSNQSTNCRLFQSEITHQNVKKIFITQVWGEKVLKLSYEAFPYISEQTMIVI